MKTLHIAEAWEVNLGQYSPACEGFIDVLKTMFSGSGGRKKMVAKIKDSKWPLALDELDKHLEWDLSATYQNPHWIGKNLPDSSVTIQLPSLAFANANGKALTHPAEIMKVAQSMVAVFKDIVRSEKPFIELRQKLMDKINKAGGNREEFADQIWEQYKDQLSHTAAERWLQRNKKDHPALGHYSRENGEWPASFKRAATSGFAHGRPTFKTDGSIESPSKHNAKEYAAALRTIVDLIREVVILQHECYIDDLEGLDVDYNELKHGDEIFTMLSSCDSIAEVHHLAYSIDHVLSAVACGLFIAMFDKHEIPKK